MAVDPAGKFAYVADISDNNVWAYSIGANGALTPSPGSPFGAGAFPLSGRGSNGQVRLRGKRCDSTVSAYSIGATAP